MTIQEIRENIFAEDKSTVATLCDCSEKYVSLILRGERNDESDKAKYILAEAERIAIINIIANGEKNKRLVEAGRILFSKKPTRKFSSPKMIAA